MTNFCCCSKKNFFGPKFNHSYLSQNSTNQHQNHPPHWSRIFWIYRYHQISWVICGTLHLVNKLFLCLFLFCQFWPTYPIQNYNIRILYKRDYSTWEPMQRARYYLQKFLSYSIFYVFEIWTLNWPVAFNNWSKSLKIGSISNPYRSYNLAKFGPVI